MTRDRIRRRCPALQLERLESRALLSVTVEPQQIALPSITHGNGIVTVFVRSDANLNVATIDASSLALSATTPDGTQHTIHLRGTPHLAGSAASGHAQWILKFRRSELNGLLGSSDSSMNITLDVQGTSTTSTSTSGTNTTTTGTTPGTTDFGSATVAIFRPGKSGHGNGHGPQATPQTTQGSGHGHGHGHG